jgi:hypothetical protein
MFTFFKLLVGGHEAQYKHFLLRRLRKSVEFRRLEYNLPPMFINAALDHAWRQHGHHVPDVKTRDANEELLKDSCEAVAEFLAETVKAQEQLTGVLK